MNLFQFQFTDDELSVTRTAFKELIKQKVSDMNSRTDPAPEADREDARIVAIAKGILARL